MVDLSFLAAAISVPLAVLLVMLRAVDAVAAHRGLGRAHPLSMAVALTLLAWSIMACAWAVFCIHQIETGGYEALVSSLSTIGEKPDAE